MADTKKKFIPGAPADDTATKPTKTKGEKAPKTTTAPKADKPAKAAKAPAAPKLPTVDETKKAAKKVNAKDGNAVKAEIQRLDEVAAAAAEAGNTELEEAALQASHDLAERASKAKKGEAPDTIGLSKKKGEEVAKDKEKVSRLKRSEITPEQEMAKQESAKKRQAEADQKKADADAAKEQKRLDREKDQAAKREESEKRQAERRDPTALLAARRERAKENGKPYPTGCGHCGSVDINANRSAYNGSINGADPVLVQDYVCRVCGLYTKAVASTGEIISKDSTVKNQGYVQTRENYHRAKGHNVDKAIELAGISDDTVSDEGLAMDTYLNSDDAAMDQIIGLQKLLAVATSGSEEAQKKARKVLAEGIVLNFDLGDVKVESKEGTVTLETNTGSAPAEQAATTA